VDGDTRVIETPRLVLRPMRLADVDDLLHLFGDPVVMAAFASDPFDRRQMEQWVERNLEHQERFGYGLFSVIRQTDGALIGDCGLERLEDESVELGYDLRRDCWNQGFATEVAAAVRDHAFHVLNLPRLISLIRQGNIASRRVAEKIGMRHEADLTRYERDYWRFAIDREMATDDEGDQIRELTLR